MQKERASVHEQDSKGQLGLISCRRKEEEEEEWRADCCCGLVRSFDSRLPKEVVLAVVLVARLARLSARVRAWANKPTT